MPILPHCASRSLLHDFTRAGRMAAIMPSESDSSAPAVSSAPRLFCKGCGYALVGLESRNCPECGRAFDPGNWRTFATRPPRSALWRWGRRVLALALLLILAAGAGVGWLWWGWHSEQPTIARLQVHRQHFSVARIGPERLNWILGERWGYLTDRVDAVALEDLKAADSEALDLESLSQVESLGLYDCEVSNSMLSRLARLKKLQRLCVWNIRIQKPDLAFLEKLPVLASLVMVGDWTGDVNFEQVGRLKHLKVLGLIAARIKDSDLQSLHGLSSLESLTFFDFLPGNTGLEHLQPLNSMHGVDHTGMRVTYSGVEKLRQAIPGLKVEGR